MWRFISPKLWQGPSTSSCMHNLTTWSQSVETDKSCLTTVHNEYARDDTLLKKHPHSRPVFKGFYARNRLPRLLNVPSALVGNMDPDHQMWQHWVAIYIDANSRGEYYDPTERPPHEYAYVNFMNKHCLHWTYNTVRVQEEWSIVCGLHCIFYLIHRCAGHSITDDTMLLENPAEETEIVQKCVLLLVKNVLWKKKEKKEKKRKRKKEVIATFIQSQSQACINAEWPSIAWLRGSNVPFHSFDS